MALEVLSWSGISGVYKLSRLKAGVHLGSAVFLKTLAGLLVIKVLAWELGPEGFGIIGQLMTLVAIAGMFAGGGVGSGLIKVLAKMPVDEPEGKAWFASAFTVSAVVSLVIGLLLCIFSGMLSAYFIPELGASLFVVLGISQMVMAFGNLSLAEASSRGDTRAYSSINISGSVIGSGLVVIAALFSGFSGVAYAVVLMPAMVSIVALVYLIARRRYLLVCSRWLFETARIKHLLSFSLITLVGALSVPLAQLYMRDILGGTFGWEQAGIWHGVVKISDVYMQFIGVMLLNYFLPRFSFANNIGRVIREWVLGVSLLLVVLLAGLFIFYAQRNFFIVMVFSDSFLSMEKLLLPQMIGDVARTVAASISCVFMARGFVRVSMAFEFVQGVILLFIFLYLVEEQGVVAAVYAHLVTYAFLALVMVFGLIKLSKRKDL